MADSGSIPRIGFRPPAGHGFDQEVMAARVWLARVPPAHVESASRLDFHQLVLVTQGCFRHTVDFRSEAIRSGSILVMRPGQVQSFEASRPWDGWVVIFRPEALPSMDAAGEGPLALNLDELPVHLSLNKASFETVRAAVAQLLQDASLTGAAPLLGALQRTQLQAILVRLVLASEGRPGAAAADATLVRHMRRYRRAIEQRLQAWHAVSAYAKFLGLSEKTLGRATQALAGLSAKAYLSQRIALEAKRMLAYTDWPIAQVADKLGFDEPTNFVKFFRREVGCAPGAFRKQHGR